MDDDGEEEEKLEKDWLEGIRSLFFDVELVVDDVAINGGLKWGERI